MGCPGTAFLNGLDELPDRFPSRSHLEDDADRARVDQRVAVGKTLGSRDEPGVEVFLVRRGVTPDRLGRAERPAFRANVIAVLVDRRDELIDRGVFLGLATAAVIEDEQVAFAAQSLGNPLDVVLTEEALIEAGAVAVGSRVAPAVEEIAPLPPATARVSPGFFRGGAVVDDPDLVELGTAERDLIELGVVSHRVDVHPVGILADGGGLVFLRRILLGVRGTRGTLTDVTEGAELLETVLGRHHFRDLAFLAVNVVHIEQLGVIGNVAVIGLGLVAVLDQVIPASPFPDDLARLLARGLDLDQAIGLEVGILHGLGPAALGDGFFLIDPLPADGQDVSVGEFDRVMVRQTLLAVILEFPDEVAIPIEFLKATARGRALEARLAIDDLGGTEQMAVVEKVGGSPAGMFARPGVNDAAFVVIEVRLLAIRIDQVEPGKARESFRSTPSFSGNGGVSTLPGGVSLRIGLLRGVFRGAGVTALARTAANVTAIAVTAVTRVLVPLIADQKIRGRMLKTPPENREPAGHLAINPTRRTQAEIP